MNNENEIQTAATINTKLIDTKEKLDDIEINLENSQEKMLLESIKRLKNPFINIS